MRIDNLKPASDVVLRFHDYEEVAWFVGIVGKGPDRRAVFMSKNADGDSYTWEGYRFNGRWAYGSSAERLSAVKYLDK